MGCYLLIPKFDQQFLDEEGECLLPGAHKGYHLNKLNNGNYLSWGGNGCDESCEPDCECFNHIEIDKKTAKEIIAGTRKNFDD